MAKAPIIKRSWVKPEHKIEKGIPLPEPRSRILAVYRLDEMEIGDSFLYEGERTIIAPAVSAWAKRNKRRFTIRKISKLKYRVWRVS